jgi:lipoprotein-anchoring transpeptidase ErfK/SrfK
VAGLPATGSPDCATWQRLNARGDVPTLIEYHVGEQDLAGPFADQIPSDLVAQAALPALSYASPLEGLAERFHAAPALLRRLNQGVQLEAGATLHVPNVLPDLNAAAVAPGAASTPQDYTVEVSQRGSSLVLRDAGGQVVYFAPATVGSRHDPLPIGDWEVTVVNWNPVFHYNPKLFWDADPADWRATIQPGPNNPVGVAWIGLNHPHYGIHGTPDPALIGHVFSHGCVRLTNWDAARVARLVHRGTLIRFR